MIVTCVSFPVNPDAVFDVTVLETCPLFNAEPGKEELVSLAMDLLEGGFSSRTS